MGASPVRKEIAMKTVQKPKSLPWLARRAGVPDHVAEALWRKALALAGVGPSQAAEPRHQAEAMQYLLRMLGHEGGQLAGGASRLQPAEAAVCQ
jgi:hypothetical protein